MGGLLRKYMEKKKITLFEQNRVNLDSYFFEPFQEISENYDTSKIFETDKIGTKKKLPLLPRPLTNFSFFMDGSRKVYKIGDIITPENRFMPVIAGQVCAGCCYRDEAGHMHKHMLEKQNYLMLSDAINEEDFEYIKHGYERDMKNRLPLRVEKYRFDKLKDDKPANTAIAVIQSFMHDLELYEASRGSNTEGHVSHVLSSRLSSRPSGWSREGLKAMAELRAYCCNGGHIETKHIKKTEATYKVTKKMLDKVSKSYKIASKDMIHNITVLNNGKVS